MLSDILVNILTYIKQSHGLGQLSVTRPSAESFSQENVLFVGASSRPGNGVPLVLIGAKMVSQKPSLSPPVQFSILIQYLGCRQGHTEIEELHNISDRFIIIRERSTSTSLHY